MNNKERSCPVEKNTLIVNFFAGPQPGAGKSSTAAGLFNKLKAKHHNVEYVQEFAKKLTWEQNYETLKHQFYVSGTQCFMQDMLLNQVDAIITDSPIIIGLMYYNQPNEKIRSAFENFLVETFKDQNNINFFINRVKKYNPKGRNQSEQEAKEIDILLKEFLKKYDIPLMQVNGDDEGLETIVHYVTKEIKNEQ